MFAPVLPPGTRLRITVGYADPPPPVALDGVLDTGTAHLLTDTLRRLPVRPGHPTVLDLGGLEFADARGLTALLRARRGIHDQGGTLTLANPSPQLRRLLRLTNLDIVLDHTAQHLHDARPRPDAA